METRSRKMKFTDLKDIEEKADNIDMFTNIKDLATAYGIILDKELKVLELNKKNDNNEDLEKVKDIMVSKKSIFIWIVNKKVINLSTK